MYRFKVSKISFFFLLAQVGLGFLYLFLKQPLVESLYYGDAPFSLGSVLKWRSVFSLQFYAIDFSLKFAQVLLVLNAVYFLIAAPPCVFVSYQKVSDFVDECLCKKKSFIRIFLLLLPYLVSLIIFLVLLWIVYFCSDQMPYRDAWREIDRLKKLFDGTLTFNDLWAAKGSHRSFFPRALAMLLAKWSHWDMRLETGGTYLLALGSFLIFIHLFKSIKIKLSHLDQFVLAMSALFAVTNFGYSTLWVWGEVLCYSFASFFVLLGLALLSKQNCGWVRFSLSVLSAVVAIFSFLTGMNYWLPALFILVLQRHDCPKTRKRMIAALLFLACLVIGVYLYGYEPTRKMISNKLMVSGDSVFLWMEFMIIFIAKYVQYLPGSRIFSAICIATFVGLSCFFMRKKGEAKDSAIIFIAIGAYVLLNGVMTLMGRYGAGKTQIIFADKVRLLIYSYPFWIAFCALIILYARLSTQKWLSGLLLLFVFAINGAALTTNYLHKDNFINRAKELAFLEKELLTGSEVNFYHYVCYSNPHDLKKGPEWVEILRQYKLSIFRDGYKHPLA